VKGEELNGRTVGTKMGSSTFFAPNSISLKSPFSVILLISSTVVSSSVVVSASLSADCSVVVVALRLINGRRGRNLKQKYFFCCVFFL
jgi:hypothetical protein